MMSEDSMAVRRDARRERTTFAVATGVLLFALGNVLVTPLGQTVRSVTQGLPLFFYAGVIEAQFAFHAIWCVLAPLRLVTRLSMGLGIGLILLAAWALGLAIAQADHPPFNPGVWREILAILLTLPVIMLAAQLPLWCVRCFFHWRVFHRCDPARKSPHESLAIRDIFIATAVVAVVLSCARLATMVSGELQGEQPMIRILFLAPVTAILSLLTTLPIVVVTLRARWLGSSLPILLAVDAAMVLGVLVLVSAMQGGMAGELAVIIGSTAAGFFGTLTGVMVIVRRLGYRVYWGRRRAGQGRGAGTSSDAGPGAATPGLGGM